MSQPANRGPCPYCREEAPTAPYEKREHVIPQSFGTFEHNLIAWNVCDQCNSVFGDELDRVLARGRYEGFLRFQLGERDPHQYRHVGEAARIGFKAKTAPWNGMILHPICSPGSPSLMIGPVKQIGFSGSDSEEPTYFLTADAPGAQKCRERFGHDVYVRSVGFTPEELTDFLGELGFADFGPLTRDELIVTESTTIRVEQTVRPDRLVFRAICKIALNYLDAICPQLSRLPQLLDIARHVRFDESLSWQPVRVSFEPTIGNEPSGTRYAGHVVTLRHDPDADVFGATVALYNQVRYDITLSPTGLLVDVPREFMTSGHLFDTHNRILHPLTHSSGFLARLLLPRHR